MRGSRVQAVVAELQGEKIDIIPWSPDAASFIVNALQPAEVAKVVLDEDAERIEVVVPNDQLSLAIGRRGQNVRLASQLTGWDIDILKVLPQLKNWHMSSRAKLPRSTALMKIPLVKFRNAPANSWSALKANRMPAARNWVLKTNFASFQV
jgi:hypothetical protein